MSFKRVVTDFVCLFVNDKKKKYFLKKKYGSNPSYMLCKKNAKVYQNIYIPIYKHNVHLCSDEPEIYNKKGERLRVIFLRDNYKPNASSQTSNTIYWDKYNFELPLHVYTHGRMLETMGSPRGRFGALVETKGIKPDSYNIFEKYRGLEKDFDLIFTYDEKLLNEIPNARFVPFCADIKLFLSDFMTLPNLDEIFQKNLFYEKSKDISMLSSNKKLCDLHLKRVLTALKLKNNPKVDTFGTFDGGGFVDPYETLKDYRYSIVFENEISAYCFTEKLTNCFATQTVPIYIGATKIGQFFDEDGIIRINDNQIDNIEYIIKQCSEQDYLSRKNAIMKNFIAVQKFANNEDYMYNTYIKDCF
ncbi:glycosyltransferase family 10 domain-containing protein [Gilliamella sp. G0441]|uniref:glycosyltransferase family 10 domain-containing protein n=1 Tax=Gilliamella sp. G0441 TaxID=3384760 RepID=UPI003D339F78